MVNPSTVRYLVRTLAIPCVAFGLVWAVTQRFDLAESILYFLFSLTLALHLTVMGVIVKSWTRLARVDRETLRLRWLVLLLTLGGIVYAGRRLRTLLQPQ